MMIRKSKIPLILITTVFLLSAVIFLAFDLQRKSRDEIIKDFKDYELLLAQQISTNIQNFLMARRHGLNLLSSFPSIQRHEDQEMETDIHDCSSYFRKLYIKDVFIMDERGHLVFSSGRTSIDVENLKEHFWGWAQKSEHIEKIQVFHWGETAGPSDFGPQEKKKYLNLALAKPLYLDAQDQGRSAARQKFNGVIVMVLDMERFLREVALDLGLRRSFDAWIIDSKGILLFQVRHPEMQFNSIQQVQPECYRCHISFDYVEQIVQKSQGTTVYRMNGEPEKLASFSPMEFENAKWIVVSSSPYSYAIAFPRKMLKETFLLITAIVLILSFGSLVFYRNYKETLASRALAKHWKERATLKTQWKKAEEALKKLSNAIEQTADMVLITDAKGIIEYVNPSFKLITGYTREEIIGKTPAILKSGKHDQPFYERLWKTILSARTYKGIIINAKKNGELFYSETTITPVLDDKGRITHFVATNKDITEQKHLQEKISSIYDLSRKMITLLNEEQIIRTILETARKILNFEVCDFLLVDDNKQELVVFDSTEIFPIAKGFRIPIHTGKGITAAVARSGEAINLPDTSLDDRYIPIRFQKGSELCVPVKVKEKVIGVINVEKGELRAFDEEDELLLSELTSQAAIAMENAHLNKTIIRAKEEWERTFDSVSDLIAIIDTDFRIRRVNKAMADRLGYTPEDMVGMKCYEAIHKEKQPLDFFLHPQLLVDDREHQVEYHIESLGGDFIITASPIYDDQGQVMAFVHLAHDITIRKKAEQALQQKSKGVQLLQEAAIAANMASSVEEAIQTVLDKVCAYSGWPIGHAYIIKETEGKLIPSSLWHFQHPQRFETFRRVTEETSFAPGVGLPGRVWSSGKPAWIKDVNKDPNFPRAKLARDIGVKSGCAFPVLIRTEVVAVLEFFSEQEMEPDESLMQIMVPIGTNLGRVMERKRAEDKLQKSEEKYRTIFENAVMGIFQTTVDGHYITANPTLARIYGYDSPEELMESLKDLNHLYVKPGRREEFIRLVEENDSISRFESEVYRKDGCVIWVSEDARAVRDDRGHLTGFEGTTVDITEHKIAEKALRESEEKYKAAVEESLIGAYIIQEGMFKFVNKRLCEILGYRYDEIVEKLSPLDLTHPDDREVVQTNIENRLRGDIKTAEYEIKAIKKNGEIIPIRVLGNVASYKGKPAIIGTMLDLSKEKILEIQLMRSQKMESLGQLAGGIAHDFNNILGIISGSLDIIQNNDLQEKSKKLINMSMDAVARGSEIVKRLLLFARTEEAKLIPVSLPLVIEDTVKILEHTFEKNISIRTNIQDSNAFIMANKEQLIQAILNICMNARDAMPSGGTLDISLKGIHQKELLQRFSEVPHEEYFALHISDSGVGMDDWTKEHIFDPFFTTKEKGKGTGLGLSIVHGIITRHKGLIDVRSGRGMGTTFSLYLPEASLPSEAPAISGQEGEIEGGRETILIVEDEEALREVLRELLIPLGYRVLEAQDGMEAIALYKDKASSVDLIILDIGLPRVSGDQVFVKLKEINSQVHVLVASGYLETPKKTDLMKLGVKAFLQKPYTLREVAITVRRIMNERQKEMVPQM
ncbi:MAG: PAS domain S-box protein [Acidobacteriota bacterium]